jgi:LysR family hydrogen peroxide-inducible transcriptional activator
VTALQGGGLKVLLVALPVEAEGLVGAPLFYEPFRAVLPASRPFATRPTLTLDDWAGGDLLLEKGHCLEDQALTLWSTVRLDRDARFASSLEMLRHMIAAGEGYSLLPVLATQQTAKLSGLYQIRELAEGAASGWTGAAPMPVRQPFMNSRPFCTAARPPGRAC